MLEGKGNLETWRIVLVYLTQKCVKAAWLTCCPHKKHMQSVPKAAPRRNAKSFCKQRCRAFYRGVATVQEVQCCALIAMRALFPTADAIKLPCVRLARFTVLFLCGHALTTILLLLYCWFWMCQCWESRDFARRFAWRKVTIFHRVHNSVIPHALAHLCMLECLRAHTCTQCLCTLFSFWLHATHQILDNGNPGMLFYFPDLLQLFWLVLFVVVFHFAIYSGFCLFCCWTTELIAWVAFALYCRNRRRFFFLLLNFRFVYYSASRMSCRISSP